MRKFFIPVVFMILFVYSSCSSGAATGSLRTKIPPPNKISGTVVVIENIAPASMQPGSNDIPLVQFAMATNQADVKLKSVQFEQKGTFSDSDIKNIKLYIDNGDDIFDATKDILLSSSKLKNNICEFKLDWPIIKPQLFFISADLSLQANGTISFLFTGKSFGTTDIAGVVGKYPFTASSSVAAVTENLSKINRADDQSTRGQIGSFKEVMSELEKEKTIKMQENEFLAQKYYEMALKLFKEFNYTQAQDKIEHALELNPHHTEAKKLLNEIQLILGSRADEIKVIKEFLQNQLSVKIQETEIVVRNHFLNGERLMAERKYYEAQSEFEAVENKLKWVPYDIGLKEYFNRAQERIKEIKNLIIKEEEILMRQRREAAARIAQEEDLKRQQEFNEKIKTLFKEAITSFEQKRFQETERLADTILALAPHFQSASELKKEAIRARHYEVSANYLQLRSERLKELYEDFKESAIPYADDKIIRYDPDVWKIASKRKSPTVIASKLEEDPDILEIKRKLKTIKHNFKLDGTISLFEVTDYIQQQYKIPIVYAQDVRQEGAPNDKKSLSLVGLPLEIGLKNLLELYNLSYTFNKNFKCVWITRLSALEEEVEWRVHNVEDLVRPIPDFVGPNIEVALTPGGTKPWEYPTQDLPAVVTIPIDGDEGLINMIKKNTGKDRKGGSTWDDTALGVTIKKIGESNKLMVVHTPSVQEEIIEFLQILRSFRTSMISIESTFLSTTDNFLEDFGLQLRDIPQASIANAPNIPGQPTVNAGFLLGGNRDSRFRTAYTFRDQNNLVEQALPPADIGGLGLQSAILGKPRVNMLINALEKTGKGTILDSPKIVAINGQRVNIAFLRQRQYIQDGDIQGGAIAYQPVLNTFSTGVVLDVKPVMSYDRKYVTVHVFPTLLELLGVRTRTLQFEGAAPGVGLPSVTQITIELPWLRLQRCRTSAVVPDKGALVLGGLKTVYNDRIAASTPFLDKIPIVGVFFRRKITVDEKRNQLIIIRAEIIELSEIEQTIQ
ncbi:MAG: hypothetical protein V1709_11175 [Planctomycetota bacterium]